MTQIVNHVALGHDRCILTRNGKEVAAIVSIEELLLLEEKLDLAAAKKVDADIELHGTVKWKDTKKAFGL